MLQDKDFKYRYSTGRKDIPIDFCELALSNSIKLDLGLGYFSSACFNVLSVGFAHFISNGGNMRLYINQYLTEDDYNLLKNNETIDFEEYILQSFYSLRTTLSKRDEHFFKCLSFLIQNKRIDIKIVVPKDGGLAHEKFGIFTDENNDKVAFTGSMNLTAAALVKNIETIECTCSWKSEDSRERIDASEQDFSEIWTGTNDSVSVFPAKKFCQEIVKTYPKVNSDELLLQEKEIIKKLSHKLTDETEFVPTKRIIREPHFPDKYPDGARPYQIQAYDAWVKNGKQGIFAMATGTGKTITSLNCALQEYQIDKVYQLLILVPTIALVEQWIDEIGLFDFKNNIIEVYSENPQWRRQLVSLKNKIQRGSNESFVIVSTYQSFTNDDFQQILPKLPDTMLLIADEAHNIGSENVRAAFRKMKIKKRIALSATPNRIYDQEGTAELENFFNDKPPYVYSFPMSQAIKEGRLMEYCYYPKMVYLNEPEMEKYADYTQKLMNLFDSETGKFKNEDEATKLLMLRKQVLHKAEDKIRALKEIVSEIGQENLKYCFVFAPEGKINENDKNDAKRHSESDNSVEEVDVILNKMLYTIIELFPEIRCNTYTGTNNKKQRSAILSGFENGDIDVLLAMKCLDEGIDVPRAEYGIFASSTGNPRQFIQRRGRLLRKHPDKTFAYTYDMIVVPNFQSLHYSKDFFKIEKSLVRGELARVAYFADLATNTHSAKEELQGLVDYYELNLSELILSINQ